MSGDELFNLKIQALLQCNPEQCLKESCWLYYEEADKCDATRFIKLFDAVMKEKLVNVQQYDPIPEENIV